MRPLNKMMLLLTIFAMVGCNDNNTPPPEKNEAPAVEREKKVTPPSPNTHSTEKEREVTPPSPKTVVADAPPSKNPVAFFPTQTGTTWTYKITIGKEIPLTYKETSWPIGNSERSIGYASRGRFLALLQNPGKKTFALKIRVKGPAKEQGILKYPLGVELEILKDELGIFEDAKKVFWAISISGRFRAIQVVTYDASKNMSSGYMGGGRDGYSHQLICFGATPGTQMSMGETDKLLLNGLVQEYGKEKEFALEFIRTVAKSEGDDSLNKEFKERKLFTLKKGLVLLEQTIDGKPSMTWTLEDFSVEESTTHPAE